MGDERQPGVKRVRLTGARFEGGRLPVDSLVELQKYQEVVRIAVEAEWRRDHPDEDQPADLHDSASLTIERIDEGSADVFLAFEQHTAYVELQAEAQEAADATIVAAYTGASLPDLLALAPEADREFREAVAEFGATLEPGQSIEFYPSTPDAAPVTITIETRKRAVEELARIDDFLLAADATPQKAGLQTVEESLTGRVTAINADKREFWLQTEVGEIHGWYRDNPELLEAFRTLVNSAADGPLTRISGDLQVKRGMPWRFRSVAAVEQVEFDNTAWGERLTVFASLPSGWDDGGGVQISSTSLDAAQMLLKSFDTAQFKPPGVFPTSDGGVLLEWASPVGVLSVEVLPGGEFELFALQRGQRQGTHAATADLTQVIAFVSERQA